MEQLTWLHLSDWHQKGPDFDRGVVRDALIKDIRERERIDPLLGHVDFVVERRKGDDATVAIDALDDRPPNVRRADDEYLTRGPAGAHRFL